MRRRLGAARGRERWLRIGAGHDGGLRFGWYGRQRTHGRHRLIARLCQQGTSEQEAAEERHDDTGGDEPGRVQHGLEPLPRGGGRDRAGRSPGRVDDVFHISAGQGTSHGSHLIPDLSLESRQVVHQSSSCLSRARSRCRRLRTPDGVIPIALESSVALKPAT